MNDRTVHGQTYDARAEIVRYARAGKWYVEADGYRMPVTVADAALKAWMGSAYLGKDGGARFDAIVRRLRKQYPR